MRIFTKEAAHGGCKKVCRTQVLEEERPDQQRAKEVRDDEKQKQIDLSEQA
ncbi:MAG: hypothetical protein IJR97_07700 [Clostridia bacterium]|nr:hypothetical protein [Clostridia bacterium]